MKRKIPLALAVLLLATLACSSFLPQAEPTAVPTRPVTQSNGVPQTEDQVPRITPQDAKAALDSGRAILIDVRSTEAYAEHHASGAVSIPLENFEFNVGDLSLEKEQWVITYCT